MALDGVTTLAGYTSQEREMNRRLNGLFAEWRACLKAGAAGRFDPAWFVTDGFYPRYTEQKKKILFIGREAYGIAGGSYIDELHACYKNNSIGNTSIGQYPFHRRLFYVAWGLTNGCQPWPEIPAVTALTPGLAEPGGLSFAFMNFSKLSNETDTPTKLNYPVVEAFLECTQASGGDFFNREIGILEPDLIITMKFWDEWLYSLGELKTLPSGNDKLGRYFLKVNGRETLLLNGFHFSARNKCDRCDFYDPMVEALKKIPAGV